jgi:integrase
MSETDIKLGKARKEYCEYIYYRIINKLKEREEYQLLSFAMLGMHLGLRQNDILKLMWEQIDFDNMKINNVHLIKGDRDVVVDSLNLETTVISVLRIWHEQTEDKVNIFPKLKRYETGIRIGELIGDIRFNNHDLRSIGLCLKLEGVIY